MLKFSVLLSVYCKENPLYLKEALESIVNQTLIPNEIVLVEDGPLTIELKTVIDDFVVCHPNLFKIIILSENKGLANALNIGANECNYDLIARMDSDDIAFPDRFEKQISYFDRNDLDVLGGQIIEFGRDIKEVVSERKVPLDHDKIVQFLKYRSPFSHPTVIFKRKVFDELKGYDSNIFPEDYDFFVRAYLKGFKLSNIPENVLWFRLGEKSDASLKRRWGVSYAKCEIKLYKRFFDLGFYSIFDFINVLFFKVPLRLLPFPVFKFLYFNVLRKV